MKLMTLAPLSALFVLAVAPMALAQLTSASQGPVVYGHHHLTVTSIEESHKFWVDALGGEAVTAGNLAFVKFPNVLVFMREAPPTGGTKGSTVNHLGFSVPSTRAMVEKVRAAGFPIVTRDELPPAVDAWFARALAVNRDNRFASAREMSDAWQQAIAPAASTASSSFPRSLAMALGIGLLIVLAVVAIVLL